MERKTLVFSSLLSYSYFIVVGGQRVAKFFPLFFQVFVSSHFYTTFILLVVVSVAGARGEMKNTSSLLFCSLPECEKLAIKCSSMCILVERYLYYGKMMNLLDIPASLRRGSECALPQHPTLRLCLLLGCG